LIRLEQRGREIAETKNERNGDSEIAREKGFIHENSPNTITGSKRLSKVFPAPASPGKALPSSI